MSFHAAQSFTFGETPSATKWNYLWENDYALKDWTAFTNATFPIALIDDLDITTAKLELAARGRVLIDTQTLGSAGASITFSGISQSYNHLEILLAPLLISGSDVAGQVQFNSDSTAANYDLETLDINSGTVSSSTTADSKDGLILSGAARNVNRIFIPFYTNAANKTAVVESIRTGSANSRPNIRWVRWTSTAAITQVVLTTSPNFASGSVAYLYGMI